MTENGGSGGNKTPVGPQTVPADQEVGGEDDGARRLAALHRAAQHGETEQLRAALMEPDQAFQLTAFALWAARDPHGAVAAVVDATQSGQPDTRIQALQLLAHSDQTDARTVLAALEVALGDAVLPVKNSAVQALAEQGGPEALRLLREAVHDPDPAVRMMVIESVNREELTLPLLREAMADDDETVRAFAAFKLEQVLGERR